MTNHIIDNTLKNLGKTVLWQYDKAVRLLSVMKYMQVLYHCAVEQLWNAWVNKVLSIDNCGVFGCSIWGSFLGVPRPTIVDNKGKTRLIATSVYRKLLKGAFYLMKTGCSYEEILGYLEIVFGVSGDDALSKWKGSCSEYGWYINLDELNDKYEPGASYEKGYVFWNNPQGDADPLGANWKCLKDITSEENTSWEAIARYVRETPDPTTRSMTEDTLLLKLYDPENVIRKIGGAPRNALSISLSYTFGDTVITAEVERRRKCGVMLVDNGDMTMEYKESPYYEDMHQDQRYLFEQRKEEFCPYPLGVKTNEPPEEWVFGFEGQQCEMYGANKAYAKGEIFAAEASTSPSVWKHFKCKEDISPSENTSFEAIKDKIEVTSEGDPLVGGLVEVDEQYIEYPFGIPIDAFSSYRTDYAPIVAYAVNPDTLEFAPTAPLLSSSPYAVVYNTLDSVFPKEVIDEVKKSQVYKYQGVEKGEYVWKPYWLLPFFWIPYDIKWKVGQGSQVINVEVLKSIDQKVGYNAVIIEEAEGVYYSGSLYNPIFFRGRLRIPGLGFGGTTLEFLKYFYSHQTDFSTPTRYPTTYITTPESYKYVNKVAYEGVMNLQRGGVIKVTQYSNSELLQYDKTEMYDGTPNFIVRGEKMCLKNGELVPAAITTFISKETQERLGII